MKPNEQHSDSLFQRGLNRIGEYFLGKVTDRVESVKVELKKTAQETRRQLEQARKKSEEDRKTGTENSIEFKPKVNSFFNFLPRVEQKQIIEQREPIVVVLPEGVLPDSKTIEKKDPVVVSLPNSPSLKGTVMFPKSQSKRTANLTKSQSSKTANLPKSKSSKPANITNVFSVGNVIKQETRTILNPILLVQNTQQNNTHTHTQTDDPAGVAFVDDHAGVAFVFVLGITFHHLTQQFLHRAPSSPLSDDSLVSCNYSMIVQYDEQEIMGDNWQLAIALLNDNEDI